MYCIAVLYMSHQTVLYFCVIHVDSCHVILIVQFFFVYRWLHFVYCTKRLVHYFWMCWSVISVRSVSLVALWKWKHLLMRAYIARAVSVHSVTDVCTVHTVQFKSQDMRCKRERNTCSAQLKRRIISNLAIKHQPTWEIDWGIGRNTTVQSIRRQCVNWDRNYINWNQLNDRMTHRRTWDDTNE